MGKYIDGDDMESEDVSNKLESSDMRMPEIMLFFTYAHLPAHLQTISSRCASTAEYMVANCKHNEQLQIGLQKLLEAKDCFVRAAL